MSSKISPVTAYLVPFLCALAVLLAVLTIALVASPSKVETAAAPQVPARIEATPVPEATIPVEDLTIQERQFLSQARYWGSTDLDTTSRTDAELLDFGRGVCPALEASGNPFEFQSAMSEASRGMSVDDGDLLELAAVNGWCPELSVRYSELNG